MQKYSSRHAPSSYAAHHVRVVKAPWVQKNNCKTRHPPLATNQRAHAPTRNGHINLPIHRPTDTPTHHVLWQYVQLLKAHALVYALGLFCCFVLGFSFLYDSPLPLGASDPSRGGRLSTPPAHRIVHRRSFFRYGLRGLLCGAGVEPPLGR